MYQQITLIGNLGADPEMRFTDSGTPVTSFRMATSRSWTNQDGTRWEKTVWFRVTAWRKLAETANTYLKKGSKVLVVGEIEDANAYIDKEGKPRASNEVTANVIRFLTPKAEGAGGEEAPPRQAPPARQAQRQPAVQSTPAEEGYGDEDIPF